MPDQDPLDQIAAPDPQDDGIWELPEEGEPDLTEESDDEAALANNQEDQSIHVIPEEGEEVEGAEGAEDPLAAAAKEGEKVAAPEEGEAIAGEEAEAGTETTAAADDPPAAPSGWDEYAQSTQDLRGDRPPEEFAKETAQMFRSYLENPAALIKDIVRLNPDITPEAVFPQAAQQQPTQQPAQPQAQQPAAGPEAGPLKHIVERLRYTDDERKFMTDADKSREKGMEELVGAVERLGMELLRTRDQVKQRDGHAAKSQFDYFRDAVDMSGQKVHPFATNRQVAAKMRILAQHDDAFRKDGAAPTAQDFARVYNEAVWLVPQVRSQMLAKKNSPAPPKAAPPKKEAAAPRTPPKPQTKQVRLPNAGGRFSKKGRPARLQIGSGFAEVPLGIGADQDQDLETIFKAALQSGHIQ